MNEFNKHFINFICTVSAMGGLLFGYDWVVIGGAKPFYEIYFGISDIPSQQGWAMSIALIGCLAGAMSTGRLADYLGRKPLLFISAVIFLLSAVGTGAFNDYTGFMLSRLVGGIAIGIASGLSPMYIAEVAPSHIRGKMVSLNQLTIVIGILAAQIANYLIAEPMDAGDFTPALMSWNCQWGWRWMFWAECVPAVAFLLLSIQIPESPRWLAIHGQRTRAFQILKSIGGERYAACEIVDNDTAGQSASAHGNLRTLFGKSYRRVLVLGLVIAIFQQWCGTNVIFNYAQEIFANAGYDLGEMLFNIVLTGVTNVVFTIVAIHTVERLGRRKLMLIGSGTLSLTYLTLGACYYMNVTGLVMVILVITAIAAYAMTLGPVTWVLLSELFPDRVRATAMAVCTFALWTASFALTYTFPLLNSWLGSYGTFWIYAAICAAGYIYLYGRLPETKGKSLRELANDLVKHHTL